MNIFFDTSSLLKLYHRETGTEELLQLFSGNITIVYLSEISKVEFSSAIWKKVRTKELSIDKAKEKINFFVNDFSKYSWIELNNDTVESARLYLDKYGNDGLRSLDAIQLACAVTVKNIADLFITSDNILQAIFKKESLKILDSKI